MDHARRVAVASNTFSSDAGLEAALVAHFPDAYFNRTGRILAGAELDDFLADAAATIVGL